jgi:hypothetical protein
VKIGSNKKNTAPENTEMCFIELRNATGMGLPTAYLRI